MTTEPLLTISAFARAVDLAPSTLRYYDEAGLLPPAEVDPRTGYRYYTPALEQRASLLRRLREIGLPVEAMRAVLAGTPANAEKVLAAHVEGARDSAREAARVAREVLAALGEEAASRRAVVVVDGPEVAMALHRVATAAADDLGPLDGVLLDVAADGLAVVATDRYWMAAHRLAVARPAPEEARLVLPGTAVEAVVDRLLASTTATLTLDRASLRVDDGATVSEHAADDDHFPAWRLVVPGPGTGRATVEVAALRETLAGVEDGPARIAVGDGALEVRGYADAPRHRLDASTDGDRATIWLSPELALKALAVVVGDLVTLEWSDPARAIRLSPVEQRRLELVVMPVRPPG